MENNKQQAIIVSLHEDINEIIQLAHSLNYEIVTSFIQHRHSPDATSYVGLGKLEEVKTFLEEETVDITVVIIDGELKPSQWFLLEKEWGVKVYDRIRLILEIFKDRAEKKEARLQVRLAELEYEKPFVRELIHRARSGEHPGLMSGGEYQVDDYYEMIKKQMKYVRENLRKIENDRKIQRQHRYSSGFYLVSLAGYTNAGKSSLLNLLSEGKVTVEDRLFSTLSTTTRKIEAHHIPVLLTDTVGFIQHLPSWIIDAFHSTLEEIEQADVVLLVIDGNDALEVFNQKIQTSLKELTDLNVKAPVLIVINKIDLLTPKKLQERIDALTDLEKLPYKNIIPVSIKDKENIDVLLDRIYQSLPLLTRLRCLIPNSTETQSFISWLYKKTHVVSISYDAVIEVIVDCNPKLSEKIISDCIQLSGTVSEQQIDTM